MLALAAALAAVALQEPAADRGIAVGRETPAHPSGHAYRRRHALIVGVDQYDEFPDLAYAEADARALAQVLMARYGFARDDVRLLINNEADKGSIEKALDDWACDTERIGADDLFVFFFATGKRACSASAGSAGTWFRLTAAAIRGAGPSGPACSEWATWRGSRRRSPRSTPCSFSTAASAGSCSPGPPRPQPPVSRAGRVRSSRRGIGISPCWTRAEAGIPSSRVRCLRPSTGSRTSTRMEP